MTSSNILRTAVTTFILACVSSSAFASRIIDTDKVTAKVDVKAAGNHSYEIIPVTDLTSGKLQTKTDVFNIKMHNDAPHSGYTVVPSDPKGYMVNGDSHIPLHCDDMTWEDGHWWAASTDDSDVAFSFASGELLMPGTYQATFTISTFIN